MTYASSGMLFAFVGNGCQEPSPCCRELRSWYWPCAPRLSVIVGDGASTKLWTDSWAAVGPLHLFAPALFAATSWAGRNRVLRDALPNNRWARDITGAPTTQVLCDYLRVWELVRSVNLRPLQPDRFIWKWLADGKYSVSSTYRAFFHGSASLLGAK